MLVCVVGIIIYKPYLYAHILMYVRIMYVIIVFMYIYLETPKLLKDRIKWFMSNS